MLEKLVQHNLRDGVGFQVDDDVDTATVGGVMNVADLGQLLVAHELAELLKQALAIHLIGDLLHDDGVASALLLLDLALSTDGEVAMPRLVRIEDALATHDNAAGGEIGTGKNLHQLLRADLGVVEHKARRVDGFTEVVRRYVGGHADRDAVRAVDQQVREARGKNLGFLQAFVVVGLEIDGLLVEIAQQFHRGLVETRLGVAHGGSRVAVDRAEVSVTVDQRKTHGERLSEANHRVVNGQVAVRVVLADNVADRTGGFHMGLGGQVVRTRS